MVNAAQPRRQACQCGGTMEPGGQWCTRCHRRGVGDIDYGGADTPSPAAPYGTPRYSRVRAGTLTFGPVGRLGLSIVPVLVGCVAIRNVYRSQGEPVIAFCMAMAAPVLVLIGLFLREVWKRDRVS